MNKILKTVVGVACVTFACTAEVRATEQRAETFVKEMHKIYAQVDGGALPQQAFNARLNTEVDRTEPLFF